jgi:hypothetical protein
LQYDRKKLAGVAGFEPANGDTKNRCLTTWPHPIAVGMLYSDLVSDAQAFCPPFFSPKREVFPRSVFGILQTRSFQRAKSIQTGFLAGRNLIA